MEDAPTQIGVLIYISVSGQRSMIDNVFELRLSNGVALGYLL